MDRRIAHATMGGLFAALAMGCGGSTSTLAGSAGCVKDTDCKGSRICVSRACTTSGGDLDATSDGPASSGAPTTDATSDGAGLTGTLESGSQADAFGSGADAQAVVDSGQLAPGDLPDPNCPAGVHTTVSGAVYDELSPGLFSGPIPNVTVYAPKSATLPALPTTLPAGVSCDALYPPFFGSAVTDATGHFVVSNVPPGTNVPIVVQSCLMRTEILVPRVTKCVDNPQPDQSIYLQSTGSSETEPADAGSADTDPPDAGLLDAGSDPCVPITSCPVGDNCGAISNSCGGTVPCGKACTTPETCGGAGTPNVCGCTPLTACPGGDNCGTVPDGCGSAVSCGGACPIGQTCGGGGTPNVCGCTPLTCATLPNPVPDPTCGTASDGCGKTLDCGVCPDSWDTCQEASAGGGPYPVNNACWSSCSPMDCSPQPGSNGNSLNCGGNVVSSCQGYGFPGYTAVGCPSTTVNGEPYTPGGVWPGAGTMCHNVAAIPGSTCGGQPCSYYWCCP
jgi:hypothetical protein